KDALNKAEGKTSPFYIAMDAEPANQNWFEVKYEEVFDNRPNLWYYGEGNWFELKVDNILNIYHTGEISKLDFKGLKEVSYVYHDKNGGKHNICTCELLKIDERLKGVSSDKKTKHTVESGYNTSSVITYSHDSSRKKYSYPNGTIRTYGKFYNPDKKTTHRLVTYKKGSGTKNLVKMPDSINKKITDKSVIYSFTKTTRRYCGPEHFACFVGALAETGLTLKSGGACEEDGTCYPSVSHINGQSIDTSYLNDKDEQKFINAMHKFGFTSQLRGSSKKKYTNTTDGGKLHNNHLHSGVLKPNYKK
ncbi:hypothetical protein V2754_09320, partial [Tenacibaculum maritimum]